MNYKRKSRRRFFLLMRWRTPPISSEFRGGVLNPPNQPPRYATAHTHTHTHTQYVILIAFPQQQWSHERTSLLRFTNIVYLVRILRCFCFVITKFRFIQFNHDNNNNNNYYFITIIIITECRLLTCWIYSQDFGNKNSPTYQPK